MNGPDIARLHNECKAKWGQDSLPPLSEIKVEWTNRTTKRFGQAVIYRTTPPKCEVNFSKQVFRKLLDKCGQEVAKREMTQTVIHELAHIANYYLYRGTGHNRTFYNLMHLMGILKNNRFHHDSPNEYIEGTTITWKEL